MLTLAVTVIAPPADSCQTLRRLLVSPASCVSVGADILPLKKKLAAAKKEVKWNRISPGKKFGNRLNGERCEDSLTGGDLQREKIRILSFTPNADVVCDGAG